MKLLDRLLDYCDAVAAERDHGLRTPEERFEALRHHLARLEREWALQVEEEARRLWACSRQEQPRARA